MNLAVLWHKMLKATFILQDSRIAAFNIVARVSSVWASPPETQKPRCKPVGATCGRPPVQSPEYRSKPGRRAKTATTILARKPQNFVASP